MKTIKITKEMLERKLDAAKHEAAKGSKSHRAFYIAEVARISAMLVGVV